MEKYHIFCFIYIVIQNNTIYDKNKKKNDKF